MSSNKDLINKTMEVVCGRKAEDPITTFMKTNKVI